MTSRHLHSPRNQSRRLAFLLFLACLPTASEAIDLLECYHLALSGDPVYRAAQATAAASREVLPQALSQLLPNLSAAGTKTRSNTEQTTVNTGATKAYDYDSHNYSLTLRQPLLRAQAVAAYQQAEANVAAAESVLDKELQDLGNRLSSTYFQALAAEDQLKQIQIQRDAYREQLNAAKRALEAGEGTRTDIDDAQAKYDIATAQALDANDNALFSKRQLESIVGQPIEQLSSLDRNRISFDSLLPVDLESWITLAESNNPELRGLTSTLESARKEVDKAKAGHLPTVDAFAQRRISQSDTENTINQRYITNQIGLQIAVPLFSGGYNQSQIRQAIATQTKVEEQIESFRRELGLKVRKAFQGVVQGRNRIDALESASRSAEQAVISTRKGIEAGNRSTIDLLNALQQKSLVNRDLALANHQYAIARVTLLGLAGQLDAEHLAQINSWLVSSAD